MSKNEYGLSQKGLDAINRMIRESPQYKSLISKSKAWYNITIAEQQEMAELGDTYEKRYWTIKGRLNEFYSIIKKLEKEEK